MTLNPRIGRIKNSEATRRNYKVKPFTVYGWSEITIEELMKQLEETTSM